MRICLILNPFAGTAKRVEAECVRRLGGVEFCEIRPVSRDCSPAQIARKAVEEGFDRIVVAGGDGSINSVINGIAPDFDAVDLGILPAGTGNDLARSLDLLHERPEDSVQAILGEETVPIDLIRVTTGSEVLYCVNVVNGGLGGRVAEDVHSGDRKRWGALAYWMTSVSLLIDLEYYPMNLTIDDLQVTLDAYGIAIANGKYIGGGFPISPHAILDDGLINITVVPSLSRLELMAAGVNYTLNRGHNDERIRNYTGKRVEIHASCEMPFSIDGEPTRDIDGVFEVVPRALRVVVGSSPLLLNRD